MIPGVSPTAKQTACDQESSLSTRMRITLHRQHLQPPQRFNDLREPLAFRDLHGALSFIPIGQAHHVGYNNCMPCKPSMAPALPISVCALTSILSAGPKQCALLYGQAKLVAVSRSGPVACTLQHRALCGQLMHVLLAAASVNRSHRLAPQPDRHILGNSCSRGRGAHAGATCAHRAGECHHKRLCLPARACGAVSALRLVANQGLLARGPARARFRLGLPGTRWHAQPVRSKCFHMR